MSPQHLLQGRVFPLPTAATELLNPPETARSYSSVYGDDKAGNGCARSMLDSEQGWSAATSAVGQWMQIDLGTPRQVVGLKLQGRAHNPQHVTGFTVAYSMDGVSFTSFPIDFTVDFRKAAIDDNAVATILFHSADLGPAEFAEYSQVTARHVRIVVNEWEEWVSMRAGVLTEQGRAGSSPPLHFPLAIADESCTPEFPHPSDHA